MKLFKNLLLILIIFLETGNLLSENNLFNVNNILLKKEKNSTSNELADKAIKKAFNKLLKKILLKDDIIKISNLSFSDIKDLVTYYNVSKDSEINKNEVSFSVTFDRDKIHNLFYQNEILYSEVVDKEFYIIPILIRENNIFIFSNNFFYENWNKFNDDSLIEFILPSESIEIIQYINQSRDNLLDLKINSLLQEHPNKNASIVLIENNKDGKIKVFFKARIQNKIISKSLNVKKNDLSKTESMEKIIIEIKEDLINLVKSKNLIDIRTPSFLNVRFILNKNDNLFLLNSRLRNIDLIENIFIQDFNKDYVYLKIKYLGKLERIIHQLNKEKISLKLINDQWFIKML